ncbi:hypothetical protein S225a_26330 [Candidatus Brocadiaceae bacterium S225]|nr:hypothetical protein S225a_26330 [Candidatus Brocadiaceae bacterium S225]
MLAIGSFMIQKNKCSKTQKKLLVDNHFTIIEP